MASINFYDFMVDYLSTSFVQMWKLKQLYFEKCLENYPNRTLFQSKSVATLEPLEKFIVNETKKVTSENLVLNFKIF